MLEIMLSTGGSGGYFPNSGPGNKYLLKGDKSLGYFGEVSAYELFDGYEVAGWGPLYGTDNGLTGMTWLKFIRNNTVLYIAKKPIMGGLIWNDVYNAGMAYGTQGMGLYPVGSGVEQFNPKKKIDVDDGRTWWLTPRLPQGMNVDPFNQTTASDLATAATTGSEWDDLLYRVADPVTARGSGEWDQFTPSVLGLNTKSLAKETQSSNVNNSVVRSTTTYVLHSEVLGKATAGGYWRPVLVLTDITGVPLVINDAGGLLGGNLLDPILQNQDITDSAVRMVQITYDLSALVSPPLLKDETFFNAATRITDVGSSISALSFFYPDPSIVDPSLQIQALDSSISALSPFTAKAGYITDLADTIIPATDYGVFTVSP